MVDKYWPQPCGDNYKVRRIWMTYYKVSHIYWNARPLSSGDKSSKKCRLKNGPPLPTMRWSPQTIGCWWGWVSSCAGPDHPQGTLSVFIGKVQTNWDLALIQLHHVPVRKITNYFQWHTLSRFDKLPIQYCLRVSAMSKFLICSLDLEKYFPIPFLHLKKAKLFYFSFRFIGVSQINNKKQEQFGFRYFPIIFFGKNNLFPWKLNRNRLPAIFYLSFFSHRAQWLWRMSIAPYYISSLSQTGPVLTQHGHTHNW